MTCKLEHVASCKLHAAHWMLGRLKDALTVTASLDIPSSDIMDRWTVEVQDACGNVVVVSSHGIVNVTTCCLLAVLHQRLKLGHEG
jgi:hypothetical protein